MRMLEIFVSVLLIHGHPDEKSSRDKIIRPLQVHLSFSPATSRSLGPSSSKHSSRFMTDPLTDRDLNLSLESFLALQCCSRIETWVSQLSMMH